MSYEFMMNDVIFSVPVGCIVAGVDEVGRGPLAGPVVAAAVILDPLRPILGLKDSKQLSEKKRDALDLIIRENALCFAIGRAEVEEIDQINILQASLLAMKRAVEALSIPPQHILVDGLYCPCVSCTSKAIVRGDQTEPAISAASIIAKVFRDHEMVDLDQQYPGYGFAIHKGYPTRDHLKALSVLGVSAIHRRSFAPVKTILQNQVV